MRTTNIISYCINNNLFTNGDNTQYDLMLSFANSNPTDYKAVATMIWLCSKTAKTIHEIATELRSYDIDSDKYDYNVYRDVKVFYEENFGEEITDFDIDNLSNSIVLEYYLEWNGIIGYTDTIIKIMKAQ